ncbi:unnamed protein product [Cuscuta epithymum]|uniref:Transmembrane protein n=1 Tax=Cuscuta epithymum TaxID=186058 RepID=A0AAV0FYF5_9ASTE|nr:unnamed protein product [Cuscuta epithymum]
MSLSTEGSRKVTWQPGGMVEDTTISSYWMNWRVGLCFLWIFIAVVLSGVIIFKYEGRKGGSGRKNRGGSREQEEGFSSSEAGGPAVLYEDEVWKTCLKNVHPAWLLGYRIVAFVVLLSMLILNAKSDGSSIFYFYTQWTFTLVTIYFGLGSMLSMYGCYQYHNNRISSETDHNPRSDDAEFGSAGLFSHPANAKQSPAHEEPNRKVANLLCYIFQIIFQVNAGAATLTDCVYWFVLVPCLTIKGYNLNSLMIGMHLVNVIVLLIEAALNCLRFPWYRIGYLILWTSIYVIFQWALHACNQIWWPYPFLKLSSPFAPLWYLSLGLMHIPCYGMFVMVMKFKHHYLSKRFPLSYQCAR